MTALQRALASVQQDPVFAYALLAALLLAVVSLLTGLARRDVAVLVRPRILLRVLGAVLLTFLLSLAAAQLGASLGASSWTRLITGLERFPLAVVALAYGPGVGVAVAALVAGLQANGAPPSWHQAVVALELAVLGWLAIYPSPRSSRWAGPFNAVLAYLLAWGTAGVALLEAEDHAVTVAALWAQQQPLLPGVLLSAALLALLPPSAYERAFPRSRIAPPHEPPLLRPPEGLADGRDPMKLTYPDLPRVLARRPRHRELEPLPGFHNDDGEPG